VEIYIRKNNNLNNKGHKETGGIWRMGILLAEKDSPHPKLNRSVPISLCESNIIPNQL